MDLSDALSDYQSGAQQQNNPTWPGQPSNPTWPGAPPAANPTWPGGPPAANPTWPGGPPAANPTWPGANPGQPTWPSPQPGAPGGWSNPAPGPRSGVPAAPQQNLVVPYTQNLPSGAYDRLLILIAGHIKANPNMITVDMVTAKKDLAFHFNPRFNEGGRQVIVRNSCISDRWGREERELKNFPFVAGQPFEIKILCTSTEFKVAVNNIHLLEFKHRITDLKSIKAINIYNDVILSRVEMETI